MLVQVVVTVVDDVFQYAHDLVGDAVHANALADRILAGKEFLLGVGPDKSDAGVGEVLGFAEGRSFREFHAPHAGIVGVHAAHPVAGAARALGHGALLEDFGRKPLQQRHFVADVVEIFDRETDFASRLGAARLHARCVRETRRPGWCRKSGRPPTARARSPRRKPAAAPPWRCPTPCPAW